MKLPVAMENTLEHCICCDMTKQCLKEGIPQHKASHPTGIYLNHSATQQKAKTENNNITKLGMKNTLEHYICCNMTRQCLKEGIPQHKASHPTGIYLNHSTPWQKAKTENNYEIRNEKYFGTLHLL